MPLDLYSQHFLVDGDTLVRGHYLEATAALFCSLKAASYSTHMNFAASLKALC